MRRRVVVTGIGCVNPLGHDVETMWSALQRCESGVAETTIFDASSFPTKISAEVKNWDITQVGEDAEIWKCRGPALLFRWRRGQTGHSGIWDPRFGLGSNSFLASI